MAWTVDDSVDCYGIDAWGRHLFSVTADGTLQVRPKGPGTLAVDLDELTDELVDRGIELPILVRFPDIVQARIQRMFRCFAEASQMYGFQGRYRGVYPIKVNQQRHLVEDLVRYASESHYGLEAGSKPELLVAMAMLDDPDALLICNGYKDRGYVETALHARRLGRDCVLVVEKLSEVETILAAHQRMGVEPVLGVRARLSNPGRGRWQTSAGDRAKFGLSALDIVRLVERLREAGKLHWLRLLHFHIGSQVPGIRTFKVALREASRLYVELVKMGAPMGILDVGGGLGVDYDGSRSAYESSMNYTTLEYAADVVSHIAGACDEADIPHPDIVTESGRATVAHSSVLLFDIVGVETKPVGGPPLDTTDDDGDELTEMRQVYDRVGTRGFQEAWHDANDVRERARTVFEMGHLGLSELARIERLYWQVCGRVARVVAEQSYVPPELERLGPLLADTYYGNFSVFQSAPDSWAIGQLFPIVPVQRLDQEPTRRGILADLTCDSDGKISQFVDRRDVKKTLELHAIEPGERYVLAMAMVGAYQEILGDLHNLFGDTNAVHVTVDEDEWHVACVVEGDRVDEVVAYVQYDRDDLTARIRRASERAIKARAMNRSQAGDLLRFYREGLDAYTYLGR